MRPKGSYVNGHRRKRAIWAFVSAHPDSSLAEIADGVGLSKSGTHYHVNSLLRTGVLVSEENANGVRKTKILRAPLELITIEDKK